jgi:hypothetical protein
MQSVASNSGPGAARDFSARDTWRKEKIFREQLTRISRIVTSSSWCRSEIGSLRNLRIVSISYVYQPLFGELVEESNQVSLAALDLDVEGARNGIPKLADMAGCPQKAPNGRPNGAKAVVDTARQTENDALPAKVAGHLVLSRHDDRAG